MPSPEVKKPQISRTPKIFSDLGEKEKYSTEEREKIAKYYQEYFDLNRLVLHDYLKSFGVETIVDIEFVAENGELANKKGKKGGGKPGLKVPTAVFVVEQSKDGSGKNPKIYIGLDFFIQHKMSDRKALWVLLHELTHFKDYHLDPKTYMDNFKRMKEIAQTTSQKVSDEYEKKSGKKIPPNSLKKIASSIERTLSSVYSNLVEDISVNHNVEKLTWYKRGKGVNERDVVELYEKLFGSNDLSNVPEAFQYLYALITSEFRGRANENSSDRGSQNRVTEGAYEAIARDYKLADGKVYSTSEIIDACLNPNLPTTVEDIPKKELITQKTRHEILDKTFLPTFLELHVKDLVSELLQHDPKDDFDLEELIKKLLEMIKGMVDGFEENSPDFIDNEDMGEVFKDIESEDKAAKGDKQKKGDKENKKDGNKESEKDKWLKENGFEQDIANDASKVAKSIESLVTPLREAWERIKFNRQEIFRRIFAGREIKGKFDIRNFVKSFPKIVAEDFPGVRLFKKPTFEIEHIESPEKIEIQMIFDYSGSQFGGYVGDQKQLAMKQIFMMVMNSVAEFNESTRISAEDINLKADVGVINFGSAAEVIIPFGEGDTKKDFNILNFFRAAKESLGGTMTDEALKLSLDNLDAAKLSDIKSKKLLRITIVVTDGGGDETEESLVELKKKYKELGIPLVCFHIGGQQLDMFTRKWNASEGDAKQDGIIVRRVEELARQISNYIVNVLNKVV